MFGIMFTEKVASEYRDWANTDHELYDAIAVGMHARGAMPEPDSREPWFMCEAHAEGDIVDRVLSIFSDSLDAALEARGARRARRRAPTAAWPQPGPAESRTERWSSTGTPSGPSIGPPPCSSPSARATARPA